MAEKIRNFLVHGSRHYARKVGRAIAERLAKDGATVALTYNTAKSDANEVVASIVSAGGAAFAIQADLVQTAAVPALFEKLDAELVKRNGSNALDILVNNAGNVGWVEVARQYRSAAIQERGLVIAFSGI